MVRTYYAWATSASLPYQLPLVAVLHGAEQQISQRSRGSDRNVVRHERPGTGVGERQPGLFDQPDHGGGAARLVELGRDQAGRVEEGEALTRRDQLVEVAGHGEREIAGDRRGA